MNSTFPDVADQNWRDPNRDEPLGALVQQYLEAPDLSHSGRGMVAGGALSPLLGALAGLVFRKGGVKHYLVFVLKRLQISGIIFPRA
jgi:hypothetical protein